jgi:uncharacterized membrane protein YqaE (UPF0057 family)
MTFDINPNVIEPDNYFIIKNGNLINNPYEKTLYLEDTSSINKNIQIFPRMRGGGILDAFLSIIQIGKVFFLLLDITRWFIKFIAWFLFFVVAVLKFLFVDMIFDFYNSIVLIVVTIFKLPIEIITALFAWVVNGVGGWMTSIWGWDQTNLTKNDLESNYFKGIDRNHGRKCYLTNNGKVPFSILLGTILCPPLGVFMDLGATGWLNIVLCVILTFMFYIPGLLYALFIIYS